MEEKTNAEFSTRCRDLPVEKPGNKSSNSHSYITVKEIPPAYPKLAAIETKTLCQTLEEDGYSRTNDETCPIVNVDHATELPKDENEEQPDTDGGICFKKPLPLKKPVSLKVLEPRQTKRQSIAMALGRPDTPVIKNPFSTSIFTFQQSSNQRPKNKPKSLQFTEDFGIKTPKSPSVPMTPVTEEVRDVTTPVTEKHNEVTTLPTTIPNVVPLNNISDEDGVPLFIIQPVSSNTGLYESLGKELRCQCYCLQKTKETPTDSIQSIARYYKGLILQVQPHGPYRIAGVLFTTLVAIEIVLLLQKDNIQVDRLILFDASPEYILSQMSQDVKHLPQNASLSEAYNALVTGALVNWLSFFRPDSNRLMLYGLMLQLNTTAEKIEAAVEMSFGHNVVASSTPAKSRWLSAAAKIRHHGKGESYGFQEAGREIVKLMRREKAMDYIDQAKLVYKYEVSGKIQGDIWLFRMKDQPACIPRELPEDFGLSSLTNQNIHIKYYNGQLSFNHSNKLISPVAAALNEILLDIVK